MSRDNKIAFLVVLAALFIIGALVMNARRRNVETEPPPSDAAILQGQMRDVLKANEALREKMERQQSEIDHLKQLPSPTPRTDSPPPPPRADPTPAPAPKVAEPDDDADRPVRDTDQWNAYNLAKKFSENEVAADKRWKSKRFRVYGDVVSIRKVGEEIHVTLSGAALTSIVCALSKDWSDAMAEVSKGDRITISGVCEGSEFLTVRFSQCEFICRGVVW